MADGLNSAREQVRATLFQGWAVAFVAVFSYFTAQFVLHLQESYWAPIAAVVVLYPDAQSTRRASRDRFLGTLIGCVIGFLSSSRDKLL